MSPLRSLDQRRAASAYGFAATPDVDLDRAQKLPAMFQINGLLATWAFLLAKKEQDVLSPLLQHLRSVMPEAEGMLVGSPEDVFLHWVGGPGTKSKGLEGNLLRALTAEAIAWSVWLKRAAEAQAPTKSRGGVEHGGA